MLPYESPSDNQIVVSKVYLPAEEELSALSNGMFTLSKINLVSPFLVTFDVVYVSFNTVITLS